MDDRIGPILHTMCGLSRRLLRLLILVPKVRKSGPCQHREVVLPPVVLRGPEYLRGHRVLRQLLQDGPARTDPLLLLPGLRR